MANSELVKHEEKMSRRIDSLKESLSSIRAGRANPAVLDKIVVEYYGTPTPINQLAGISVPEARTIIIQPWEASILREVERAIAASDLGINPNNDGKCIRLNFPPLTEERRKDLTKLVKKYGEETKIAIRNVRRDAMEIFKKQQKTGEISEDDLRVVEKDTQKLTDNYCEKVDHAIEGKEKELMEV